MNRRPIALTVSLAVVASLALAPAALAGRAHGRAGGGHANAGGRAFLSHPSGSHHFAPRPHPVGSHHFAPRRFVRPFLPFGLIAAPVVYAPSPLWYGPSVSYEPSAYYDPPVSYSPPTGGAISVAPSPQPAPNVVQYPTGRYELRGDGVTTPYTWVWIPNPPPPPPPAAPPTSVSEDPAPARRSPLYRWTDEQDVVHWTGRMDAVPLRYRAQAKERTL